MSDYKVDVTVYEGKYRYVFDQEGALVYRYGELWRDCCGDKFILAMAQEIEELQERIKEMTKMTQKRKWTSERITDEHTLINNDWDDKEFFCEDDIYAEWLCRHLNHLEEFIGENQ